MEITHEIRFYSEDNVDEYLNHLGIRYKKSTRADNRYAILFQIAESDTRWPLIQALMQENGKTNTAFDTHFSDKEILSAEWLRIWGGYPQIGYPQPESRWQEEHFNYEEKCPSCGSFRQVSAFFIQSEPKPSKYDFRSLHWTSALFAAPRVFAVLEANDIRGYERWPVFIHKTKEPSATVAQLYIPAVDTPIVVGTDDLDPFICEECGALKYNDYHKRGIMHLRREAIPPDVDIFETYEWFGEGHQPRREILVSNRVAQLAYAEKWKGLWFKVAEVA